MVIEIGFQILRRKIRNKNVNSISYQIIAQLIGMLLINLFTISDCLIRLLMKLYNREIYSESCK